MNSEYKIENKKEWPTGEWHNEPDRKYWVDENTGLDCLIVRNSLGSLCGYVGIMKSHPAYGKEYYYSSSDSPEGTLNKIEAGINAIEVHGGLTFTSSGNKSEAYKIDKDVWWFGFDCAHLYDLSPGMIQFSSTNHWKDEIYRNMDFVTTEVESLANQLKKLEA